MYSLICLWLYVLCAFWCPLQHDQDAEAIDLDESYTIEEETGDSASDKSEERTDDFEDNEDDTDAGKSESLSTV